MFLLLSDDKDNFWDGTWVQITFFMNLKCFVHNPIPFVLLTFCYQMALARNAGYVSVVVTCNGRTWVTICKHRQRNLKAETLWWSWRLRNIHNLPKIQSSGSQIYQKLCCLESWKLESMKSTETMRDKLASWVDPIAETVNDDGHLQLLEGMLLHL